MTIDLTILSNESLQRRGSLLDGIDCQLTRDLHATRVARAETVLEQARRALKDNHPDIGYLEFSYAGILEGDTVPTLTFSGAYTFAGSQIGEITAEDLDFDTLTVGDVEAAISDAAPIDEPTSRTLAVD